MGNARSSRRKLLTSRARYGGCLDRRAQYPLVAVLPKKNANAGRKTKIRGIKKTKNERKTKDSKIQ